MVKINKGELAKVATRVDFEHVPTWIDTNSIFSTWKPRRNYSGLESIPP